MIEVLFRSLAGLYVIALVAYLRWFRSGDADHGKVASGVLLSTIAVHVATLAALGASRGIIPPISSGESMSVLAVLTAAIYALAEARARERGLGILALGLILAFALLAAWFGPGREVSEVLRDLWFAPHALAIIAAFASFTMSAFLSMAYLLQYRQLRSRNPGRWWQRLPPLEQTDRMTRLVMRLGFLFLTLGLVLGMFLARSAWGEAWSWDPKQCMTLLTWLLYGAALVLRRSRDWQGGRIATTNLVAFGSVITGMLLIRVFFDTVHRFG